MAFQLSPGVNVTEIDLTTVVPAVGTTEGAIAGIFRWGPVDEQILISSEVELVNRFGKPHGNTSWQNHETWFTAANFLSYSDALYVVRVNDGANTAVGSSFEAAYPGELGNSIQVAYCDSDSFGETSGGDTLTIQPSSNTGVISSNTVAFEVGDIININDQKLQVATLEIEGSNTNVSFASKYIATEEYANTDWSHQWGYADLFDGAPAANTLHVVVVDEDGEFTGIERNVVEVYNSVSTNAGAKSLDGSTNYIADVLSNRSQYVRWVSNPTGNGYETFTGGSDGNSETSSTVGTIAAGYDLFRSSETIDISLVLLGHPRSTVLSNYIIDNLAEYRKDVVAFITPSVASVNAYTAQDVVDSVATLSSSSYAVVDSGYKYQYDKYADVYRWIPLNGDVAGLCARTDDVRDPWFSPAGYSRGNIKNIVKLALNPDRSERDLLYKNYVNPVVTQPGQGTVLFGDKTFQGLPSAFDRINVRRLFIVLEKAIAIAAKSTLFEFNDEFTRAQFRNLVEPFLRDVQGRRGIFDFRVVCDETNNTPEVIDSNRFVGDIYIKPARSINFIQLNFIAVRTGVEFSEVVGQF